MRIRSSYLTSLLAGIAGFLSCAAWGDVKNLVENSDFENGLVGWSWGTSGEGEGTGAIDGAVFHSGNNSFKMTYASEQKPHRYGRLTRAIEVEPLTTYRITTWGKGEGVGFAWIGGGRRWALRRVFPKGNFDWRQESVEYTTDEQETTFPLMIVLESPTRALWVDEVQMVKSGRVPGKILSREEGIPTSSRFYPVLPVEEAEGSPVVKIRAGSKDDLFGADVRIYWSMERLIFDLDVIDPTFGPVSKDAFLWMADCVQFSIDTRPEVAKEGYTEGCYELDFAFAPDGEVAHNVGYTADKKEFDWTGFVEKGERTDRGYRLRVEMPWRNLGVDPATLPRDVGVNIVLNDGQNARGRRFTEWTQGTGIFKNPRYYTRAVLLGEQRPPSLASMILPERPYDHHEWVVGRFLEYAVRDLKAAALKMTAYDANGEKLFDWLDSRLPETPAGSIRMAPFMLPAQRLGREGEFRITAAVAQEGEEAQALASGSVKKIFVRQIVDEKLKVEKARFARVKEVLKPYPQLETDRYIRLGLVIVDRFLDRIERGRAEHAQDPNWYWLQITEVGEVLDHTEREIKQAVDRGATPTVVPWHTGGKVTTRNGVLYTETTTGEGAKPVERPYYFYGYGHFSQAYRDIPNFNDLGATAIQQSAAVRWLKDDFLLEEGTGHWVDKLLNTAHDHGVKVDIILSPHYFTGWPTEKWPEIRGNFAGYNPDHPLARFVIRRFLEAFTPLVKDKPGLLSLCLSNEPEYHHSGHDPYSRPYWVEYLKRVHKDVKNLNELYDTDYKRFEDVPPSGGRRIPDGVPAQRAYYDWIRFNQEHWADWHRWMNDIIKRHGPEVATHSKIKRRIWGRSNLSMGVDPELFTEIGDWAGNDGSSGYSFDGPYVIGTSFEMWYDLLHTFGGKPVVNYEQHVIGYTAGPRHVSSEFFHGMLWQSALHHLCAAAMWVWEEASHHEFKSSIYFRPANIYAAGRAMFDLNRLSEEVAAVSNATPTVGLLYSVPSVLWEADYPDVVHSVYEALTFMGQPVTFVSERQLAAGKHADVNWIIVPHATHVTDETVNALADYVRAGGKVILAADQSLALDEYHRNRDLPSELTSAPKIEPGLEAGERAQALKKILTQGGLEIVAVHDVAKNAPAWGVEYRIVAQKDRTLVSMINFLRDPQTVQLALPGQAMDLLSGETVDLKRVKLESMVPVLLEVRAAR